MEKYKTIIVGAGPGGLRCAKILAEQKEDFILFDKRPEIQRKICTGIWGLTPKTQRFNLPEELFERKFNKVVLLMPHRQREVKKEDPFVATLDRKKLELWLLEEARNSGAKIVFNSLVSEVGENFVVVNGERIFFDNLVGADGSLSAVRKNLNLPTKSIFAAQYLVEGKFENMEIYFNSAKFGPGYVWVAPYKNIGMVGAGVDLDLMPLEKLETNLDEWCRERKYNIDSAKFEGAFINYNYRGYQFGNKFLVGDAAGFSSGLTGEGIYFALTSGEDIAKIIIDKNHQPKLIHQILEIKRKHEIVADIMRKGKYHQIFTRNLLFSLLKFESFKDKVINLTC